MANGADTIIIDNGGSGRVGQKNQSLAGQLTSSRSALVAGAFTGGSIDYKPRGASVTIPSTAKSVVANYTGGTANFVTAAYDNASNQWKLTIDSSVDGVDDVGVFGQHLYQFDGTKHMHITGVDVDGVAHATPSDA